MAVVMLVEHVAAQLRPEVPAVEVRRHGSEQPLAVRRLPDLPAIAGVVGLDTQVLHDEVAIALEPRAGGNRRLRRELARLMDRQLLGLAAFGRTGALARRTSAATVRRAATIIAAIGIIVGFGFARRLHPARLEPRPRLLPLQDSDLRHATAESVPPVGGSPPAAARSAPATARPAACAARRGSSAVHRDRTRDVSDRKRRRNLKADSSLYS